MAVIKRNLKNILDDNTLVFEGVPDIDGNTEEDGVERVWTVRPLTIAQEHEAELARMRNANYLQRLITVSQARWKAMEEGSDPEDIPDEDFDPMATAEQWAPIVAALVAEPRLDVDYLMENFHGMTLRVVGEEAEAFFRDLPARRKENRETRRSR